MSKSRMINTSIWDDEYFADLDPQGKLAWMYILTNPASDLRPFYKLPSKRISDFRLGFELEPHLRKFEADGKIKLKNDWVYLPKWIKHQSLNDNQKKGIQKAFEDLDEAVRSHFLGLTPTLEIPENKPFETLPNPSEPLPSVPNDSQPLPNPSDKLSKEKLSELNLIQEKLSEVAEATSPPKKEKEDIREFLESLHKNLIPQSLKPLQEEEIIKAFLRLKKENPDDLVADMLPEAIAWLNKNRPDWKYKNTYFKIKDWLIQTDLPAESKSESVHFGLYPKHIWQEEGESNEAFEARCEIEIAKGLHRIEKHYEKEQQFSHDPNQWKKMKAKLFKETV